MLSLLFLRGGGGGVEDGLSAGETRLGSLESNVPLKINGGDAIGDRSDGSGDCGLSS